MHLEPVKDSSIQFKTSTGQSINPNQTTLSPLNGEKAYARTMLVVVVRAPRPVPYYTIPAAVVVIRANTSKATTRLISPILESLISLAWLENVNITQSRGDPALADSPVYPFQVTAKGQDATFSQLVGFPSL